MGSARADSHTYRLSLTKRTKIRAKAVFILMPTGRLIIDATSSLNTDGTARGTKGTDRDGGQGASYVGQGGYCGSQFEDLTYGDFDMKPDMDNLLSAHDTAFLAGSVGKYPPFAAATGGGGRIHIDVDTISLQGAGH